MKVTIFGASGNIGRLVVKKALAEGYDVKACIRGSSIKGLSDVTVFANPHLEIIEGELSDYQKIEKAVMGADAVISTLGPSMNITAKGYPVFEGHKNIVKAMTAQKVRRFITIGTPSIRFEKDKMSVITIFPTIMASIMLRRAYKEIVQIGDMVKSSNLDWTIVRFLQPTNNPATGNIKVTFGDSKIKFAIPREDIAAFVLKQVKDPQYICSMPIIGT